MIFSYDTFNRIERPFLYLATPSKKYYGVIHNTDLHTNLCFNSMSELTFNTYEQKNNEMQQYYNEIETLKLVEVQYVGWFQITKCVEHGEGEMKYKEVTALSLEYELSSKILNAFGQMGIKTDEQGGLDRYCLYNILDIKHSILHIIAEKAPQWTVGHVDQEITNEYRTFTKDSVDAYSFLTDDVSKAYECIFVFDTYDRKINAYKLENVGKQTSIYLSLRNVIEHVQIEENADEIYTVMSVSGGDYDGSPLQISDVNPVGTSYITNFEYYFKWFSDELRQKISEFKLACDARKGGYTSAMLFLKNLMLELENLKHRVPTTEHSKNWEEYGIMTLQDEFDYYNERMSLYLDGKNETKRNEYFLILYGNNGIDNALKIRKNEYDSKQLEINIQKDVCDNFILNMEKFLGNDLYKELSSYFYFTDFIDDTFVATKKMTDSEILDMKLALYKQSEKKLSEVAHPAYTMTIDSENFIALEKYRSYSNQIQLGCLVTVELSEERIIYPRLLKLSMNWDDLSDFSLVFSSKTKLDDGLLQLEEVQRQVTSASSSHILSGIGWDAAKNQTTAISEFMNSAFNTSLNKLFNGKNEQFKIDGTGTLWRKWLDDRNDYSPNQMWGTSNGLFLTDSAWESVAAAIGELTIGTDENGNEIILYGIAAPLLLGKILMSESLYISNTTNSFTINNDGFIGTNGKNSIKITPNDPECLFSIWNDLNKEAIIFFDSNGDSYYKGNMTIGKIFSQNYLDTGGTQGSMLDLTNGKFQFSNYKLRLDDDKLITFNDTMDSSTMIKGGEIVCNKNDGDFIWMDSHYSNADIFTEIKEGIIRLQFDASFQNLFLTPNGISTTIQANDDSAGTIDFYSALYGLHAGGSSLSGITIRTNGSPVGLMSNSNSIIINPDAKTSQNMFVCNITNTGNGHIRFGNFNNKIYNSGIALYASENTVKITDGESGLGNLVCNDIDLKTGRLNGSSIQTKKDLDKLETDWSKLLTDSYNKGNSAGYDSGYSSGYSAGYSAGSSK